MTINNNNINTMSILIQCVCNDTNVNLCAMQW